MPPQSVGQLLRSPANPESTRHRNGAPQHPRRESHMNVRRLTLLALGLTLTSLLGGCVGQGEYDRLYEVNASLTAQNKDLARQLEEERQAKLLLQKNGMSGETTVAALQRQNAALRAQL